MMLSISLLFRRYLIMLLPFCNLYHTFEYSQHILMLDYSLQELYNLEGNIKSSKTQQD